MSPRPGPDSARSRDEYSERRTLQGWLRPPYALDEREQHRMLGEDSTDHGARRVRAVALEEWVRLVGGRYVLLPAQLEALHRFLEDKGPRPSFVHPATFGSYLTTEERNARDLAVAARREEGPKEDPIEPGRYVQPRGPFARPGDPEFYPAPS